MKITRYISSLAIAAGILLSAGCSTLPIEKNGTSGLLVGPISTSKATPIPELVRQILDTCKRNNQFVPVECEFRVRDCRVSDNPTTQYFHEPNPSAMADWGNASLNCSPAIPIEAALELVLDPNLDFHVSSSFANAGKPRITIGPPELVADHPAFVRRTYKIPKNRANALSNLPSRLSATGPSLAYDPQSGLLNVIDDEQHSTVGDLLNAIGAKQIIGNPQIPEL